jgi:hypothetical protein
VGDEFADDLPVTHGGLLGFALLFACDPALQPSLGGVKGQRLARGPLDDFGDRLARLGFGQRALPGGVGGSGLFQADGHRLLSVCLFGRLLEPLAARTGEAGNELTVRMRIQA